MAETPRSLIRFLLDLDEPRAITLRQTVTLSEIIDRAREAAKAENPEPSAVEKVAEALHDVEVQLAISFPHGFDSRDVMGYQMRDSIHDALDRARKALGLEPPT